MPSRTTGRLLRIALGFIVSLALLYFAFRDTDWPLVFRQLRALQYWAFAPAFITIVFHYILRAFRWGFLVPGVSPRKNIKHLFDSFMVGTLATFVLPLRAGEFVRPYLLSRYTGVNFSTCFMSVVVERFFDLCVVLLSFALMLPFVPDMPGWVNKGAIVLTGMAAAIFVVMVLGSFLPEFVLKLVRFFARPMGSFSQRIESLARHFLQGAMVLRSPRTFFIVASLSLAVWISGFAVNHVFFWLFSMHVSFVISVTISVILALAVAAPSAPGFIGVYQMAIVASFALFKLPQEQAVAYAIVTHLFQFAFFIVCGGYVLLRDGLHLTELAEKNEEG